MSLDTERVTRDLGAAAPLKKGGAVDEGTVGGFAAEQRRRNGSHQVRGLSGSAPGGPAFRRSEHSCGEVCCKLAYYR